MQALKLHVIVLACACAAALYISITILMAEASAPSSSQQAQVDQPLTEETMNNFKALGKSAFVVGYTGEVGKELTRALYASGLFKRIVLVGRRMVDYSEDPVLKNAEQVQVDFDKILEREELFKDIDIGFCCLGTTRTKHGLAEFLKVDYDYVVNTARAAKNAGVKRYSLVSAGGANEKSWNTMFKTKGRSEKAVTDIGFEQLSIWRPGALLCDRTESRPHETVLLWMMKPIFKIAPTFMSVPTRTVGLAMLYRAVVPPTQPVEIIENTPIHHLAAKLPTLGDAKAEGKK